MTNLSGRSRTQHRYSNHGYFIHLMHPSTSS
jgi:hypothetical protein